MKRFSCYLFFWYFCTILNYYNEKSCRFKVKKIFLTAWFNDTFIQILLKRFDLKIIFSSFFPLHLNFFKFSLTQCINIFPLNCISKQYPFTKWKNHFFKVSQVNNCWILSYYIIYFYFFLSKFDVYFPSIIKNKKFSIK